MDERFTTTDAATSVHPPIPGTAVGVHQPRRPSTPARREVLREFRRQVANGTYQPDVDALSSALASWLLRDGLADLEPM